MFQRKKPKFEPTDKLLKVQIKTVETELEFNVQPSTTGKQLFEQTAATIGLREVWFFGLQFKDPNGEMMWLDLDKPVNEQDHRLSFKLRAKFYPEDVTAEIHQDITLRLFYLQIKDQILQDQIFCPPDQAVLLAAYSSQAREGDYPEVQNDLSFFDIERFLCRRVTIQYKLSIKEWEQKIFESWIELKGMSQREAMIQYLKLCEELEMYGVTYFDIRNKKGSNLYLGIINLGLSVYEHNNMLTPRIGFQWSEISDISFDAKKFVIKSVDKKTGDFVFFVQDVSINEQIINLCMGNHEMYLRRRQPETSEIIKLKQQIQEERLKEQAEHMRLIKEHEEREIAEAKQREYAEKLIQANMIIQSKDDEIAQVHDQLQELERQLAELGDAKEELQIKEDELNELNNQLLSERALGEEERMQLTDQINERERQIVKMKEQIESSTNKTNNLQREVSRRSINTMPSIAEVDNSKPPVVNVVRRTQTIQPSAWNTKTPGKLRVDNVIRRIEPDRPAKWNLPKNTGSTNTPLQNSSNNRRSGSLIPVPTTKSWHKSPAVQRTEVSTPKWNAHQSSLQIPSAQWSGSVKEKMKLLSQKLEIERDPNATTEIDVLHKDNVTAGRSRRQTLALIQSGNTKKRVEQFENL